VKKPILTFFNHSIVLNILFCISYFSLAILGFKWGTLTTNATLLWPPSGLAVFGALVFGRRAIPGLLLGAIFSSQLLSFYNPINTNLYNLAITSLSGLSSILQAMVIARYARRYFDVAFRVSTMTAIFCTLGIMASCTIATTISNLIFWQVGLINIATALQNWSVWWLGDSIGVLIVTPLLLWFYQFQT
jgi:integral membrane sensor domain MASE1